MKNDARIPAPKNSRPARPPRPSKPSAPEAAPRPSPDPSALDRERAENEGMISHPSPRAENAPRR